MSSHFEVFAARDFVRIGGRLMINPDGGMESSIDQSQLFGPDSTPEARMVARRFADLESAQGAPTHLYEMVLHEGRLGANGWRVLDQAA
jgi:hypothetical protein